jgi:hypothetical protein
MTKDVIEGIVEFNEKAGLLNNGMDSFNETAYIFEEAFEGYEDAYVLKDEKGNYYPKGHPRYPTSRQLGLSLMNSIREALSAKGFELPSDVAELDKAIDLIVFSVGKMAKMGLTADQIKEAINVVNEANLNKLGGPKDEAGKQLKPEGWVGPEKALQGILDSRKGIDD